MPGAVELRLKAVRATLNGAAAAATWLPAVQLISDSGNVIATATDQNVTVAAGGAADVSWFRGVKPAAAASVATGSNPWAQIHNAAGGAGFVGAIGPQYVSIHDTGGVDQFETSDATVFANASTSLFTGSPTYGIQINAAGTYRWEENMAIRNDGTAGKAVTAYWSASGGSAPSFFQFGRTSSLTGDTWDASGTVNRPHISFYEYFSVSAGQVGAVAVPYIQLQLGGSVNVQAQVVCQKISDYVAVKL